ncbi:RCC1 domain-containing protein [Kitasatospora sp. NPDC004240]
MDGWGANTFGQLGDGTNGDSNVPMPVTMLAAAVLTAAAGGGHSLARLDGDTVQCWGVNSSGQLGDSSNNDSNVPVTVIGLSGVDAVAGGGSHSLALLGDGTVQAWGSNVSGQLGDGTNNDSNVPVGAGGFPDTVVKVACGGEHSLALLGSGEVMAWGANTLGQLGDGTLNDSAIPVSVSGVINAVDIAGGRDHSLAVLADGTVLAWGGNGAGQLGDGTNNPSSVPVGVFNLTGVTAVGAGSGGNFSLALLGDDGTMQAWGDNSSGQLGDATNNPSNVPVAVQNLASTVLALAAGSSHSLALLSDNTLQAWGDNGFGQLGDGTNSPSNVPITLGSPTAVISLAAGDSHSLAV